MQEVLDHSGESPNGESVAGKKVKRKRYRRKKYVLQITNQFQQKGQVPCDRNTRYRTFKRRYDTPLKKGSLAF